MFYLPFANKKNDPSVERKWWQVNKSVNELKKIYWNNRTRAFKMKFSI